MGINLNIGGGFYLILFIIQMTYQYRLNIVTELFQHHFFEKSLLHITSISTKKAHHFEEIEGKTSALGFLFDGFSSKSKSALITSLMGKLDDNFIR